MLRTGRWPLVVRVQIPSLAFDQPLSVAHSSRRLTANIFHEYPAEAPGIDNAKGLQVEPALFPLAFCTGSGRFTMVFPPNPAHRSST